MITKFSQNYIFMVVTPERHRVAELKTILKYVFYTTAIWGNHFNKNQSSVISDKYKDINSKLQDNSLVI